MKFRELLSQLLKSVKRGRIHRLLKVLMVFLFIYLSFQVGRELVSYYLLQKGRVFISVNGLKWDFSVKRGEFSVRFKDVEVDSGKFSFSAQKGRVGVLLYDSVLNLRPHLSVIEAERVEVSLPVEEKGGESSFRLPPFTLITLDRLRLGYLLVERGEFKLYGREIFKSERELGVGGIFGKVGDKFFYLSPFRGYLEGGELVVRELLFSYGDVTVRGGLRFNPGRVKGVFEGGIWGSGFSIKKLTVKINGDEYEVNGRGEGGGRRFRFSGEGKYSLRDLRIIVSRAEVESEGVKVGFRGALSKDEVNFRGTFSGNAVERGIEVRGMSGSFTLKGKVRDPLLRLNFRAEGVKTPFIDLSEVKGRGELSREGGEVKVSSRGVKGELKYGGGRVEGRIEVEEFSIGRLKPVAQARRRYGGWIPSLRVTGELSVGYGLPEGSLEYGGKFKVDRFAFRGFESEGSLAVKGNKERLSFSVSLSGKNGKVEGAGEVRLKERSISSHYTGQGLELSSLDFLRKLGLEGKISGSGRVWGSLRNPKANFEFSSNGISLFGVFIPSVEGSVSYGDYALSLSATSPVGIRLEELLYGIKEKKVGVKVSLVDFPSGSVLRVVEGFGLKLPFELKGRLTGNAEVKVPLERVKESLVKVELREFMGKFKFGNLVEVSGNSKGQFKYQGGLFGGLKGKVEEGSFKGIPFKGGEYRVSFGGEKIEVNYKGVGLAGELLGIESRGEITLELGKKGLAGRVDLRGRLEREFGSVGGEYLVVFGGGFDNFTVKISGNGKVESEYLKKPISFKVEGALLEPQNIGSLRVYGDRCDLHLLLFGERGNAVGKLRDVELKSPQAEVKINLAFVSLEFPNLRGSVSIPTLTIKPYGFYKLYTPTGVYLKVEGKRVSISPFTLSYVDGWIRFENPSVEPISSRFEGEVGVKGLIYLAKLNRVIPYSRGSLKVRGKFSYGRELHYRASWRGEGITIKSTYLLDRAIVNTLAGTVEDGRLEELKGDISVGDGTVIISRVNRAVAVAISQVLVGQLEVGKSLLSGNLMYDLERKSLTGNLELSRTKLFFNKKEKEEEREESSQRVPVRVRVGVIFDEPVRIKGELFWIELLPSLKLTTVNGELVISGNFYVTDGQIDYMGKKFKVLYGSGTIEDLSRKKGKVSILASTHISGYYVYMKIEGDLSSPTIYLTSDPPLTKEQIMNLIMTGVSPEQIEASSELFPVVQIAYYAASSLFKPIEGKFRKALGLESFSVEPYITKYGETVAKLTVAKRLSKRIRLIGYETTGQNPEYGGSVELYLNDKYYLELRYNSYYGPEAGIGFEVMVK